MSRDRDQLVKAMVCFRTAHGRFALPIEATLSVTTTADLVPLVSPRPDVVGVLPGDPPIPVLATFGAEGAHVIVGVSDGLRFGVQVVEVLGVQRFDDDDIGPPPAGQEGELISGWIRRCDELTLVVDAKTLAARL
jgi:chemotaxis signal transduction protein